MPKTEMRDVQLSRTGRIAVKKPMPLLFAAILASCGPVPIVSFVRTEPGMFKEYLRYLASTYKKIWGLDLG
jgi:hypothetical protein